MGPSTASLEEVFRATTEIWKAWSSTEAAKAFWWTRDRLYCPRPWEKVGRCVGVVIVVVVAVVVVVLERDSDAVVDAETPVAGFRLRQSWDFNFLNSIQVRILSACFAGFALVIFRPLNVSNCD